MKKSTREFLINKKIFYNFSIEKTFECGLQLKGWEIKSIREKKINIVGSYVVFKLNEPYLLGAAIRPTSTITNVSENDKNRNIKLLLHKKEINTLYSQHIKNNYTIVPISLFWERRWCKLKIGVGKGKNKKDKRDNAKITSWKKDQSRIFKKIKFNN